jgi:hypothetical protein
MSRGEPEDDAGLSSSLQDASDDGEALRPKAPCARSHIDADDDQGSLAGDLLPPADGDGDDFFDPQVRARHTSLNRLLSVAFVLLLAMEGGSASESA